MLLRPSRTFALLLASFAMAAIAVVVDGCGSDSADPVGGGGDGSTTDSPGSNPDGATPDDSSTGDGGTDSATDAADGGLNGKGETCIGFAKGTPCGANGLPDYGYVCFNGSPPGIAGCKLASSSGSFGDTYCCTENKCVAEPDQDKECKVAATPHRYQCPPEGDAGNVAPPAGCADGGPGGSPLERFYCCP
jgi:hypothetical protein